MAVMTDPHERTGTQHTHSVAYTRTKVLESIDTHEHNSAQPTSHCDIINVAMVVAKTSFSRLQPVNKSEHKSTNLNR